MFYLFDAMEISARLGLSEVDPSETQSAVHARVINAIIDRIEALEGKGRLMVAASESPAINDLIKSMAEPSPLSGMAKRDE